MIIKRPEFDWQLFEEQLAIFLPCVHRGAEPRRKTKCNGQPFYKLQCPDCGKALTGQLAFEMVDEWRETFGPIKPFDEQRHTAWVERRCAVGDLLRCSQAHQRNARWWASYEEHLCSREWRQKRVRVLARAGGVCENCRAREAKHIHHLTYARLGEEWNDDLMAVCIECHQSFHPNRPLLAAL